MGYRWATILLHRHNMRKTITELWQAVVDVSRRLLQVAEQQYSSAQRAQTSAMVSDLNQKWSGIRIRISGLIRMWIQTSDGSLPNVVDSLSCRNHFAECSENRPVTVWEMQKSLIAQRWGEWKDDPESVSGTGSPPKVNQFFRLV